MTHHTFALAALFTLLAAVPSSVSAQSLSIQGFSPGAITPGTQATFYVAASGFADATFKLTDAFSGSNATVGTLDKYGYFTWTPTVYDAGVHNLTIVGSDLMKNAATTTISLVVASNSLLITDVKPSTTVATGRPFSFTVTAPGFSTPTFNVYDSVAFSTVSSGTFSSAGVFTWTPTTDDTGTHALRIIGYDSYGHSAQATLSVTVINPKVTTKSLVPGGVGGVGTTFSLSSLATGFASSTTFSVSDTFNGSTTVSSSNMTTSGQFYWKPVAADLGSHTIAVVATDPVGNAATTTVPILVTNAPPTVTTPVANTTGNASTAATNVAAPASAPTSASNYRFAKNLAIGSQGADVTALQNRLIALGYLRTAATGYFGTMTASAVKLYQGARGLPKVGNVGPATRASLNSL